MNSFEGLEFADRRTAERVVKDLYPGARRLEWVEHGYDNVVALVDGRVAVRFPRRAEALARSRFEAGVLRLLKDFDELSIPRVIGVGDNPAYLAVSFLPGDHVRNREIREWSEERQAAFGRDVARFVYALHSLDLVEQVEELKREFGIDKLDDGPWEVYFRHQLMDTQLPTMAQGTLAKKYYTQWRGLGGSGTVVIHDDLHSNNMMFDQEKLIGVLDFGDAGIGSREQELRQLYRINEMVLMAAVEEYERLWGGKLNVEAIKIWAVTQEMAAYAEGPGAEGERPAYKRAVENLRRWVPEGRWGE